MKTIESNKQRTRLSNGVMLTYPEDYVITLSIETAMVDVVENIEFIFGKKINSVHVNKDNTNPEMIYGINIVFQKNK